MFTFITNTLSSNTNNTITTQTRRLGQLTKAFCDPQNPNLVSLLRKGLVYLDEENFSLNLYLMTILPKVTWGLIFLVQGIDKVLD